MLDLTFQTHQHVFYGCHLFNRFVGFPDAIVVTQISFEVSEDFEHQRDKSGHETT